MTDVLAGRGPVSYDELADQSGVGRSKLGPLVAFLTRSQIVEESGGYLQLRGDLEV